MEFGSYKNLSLITKGGQGEIYRTGQTVIKVTKDICEASILNLVSHPNIIELKEVVVEGDKMGLVLPYHSPISMKKGGETERLLFLFKLAHAIAFLHDNDIIHRDIKLSNVLVNKGSPVLIDFGISCICDHLPTSTYVGTVEYMPPELGKNKDNVYDFKTDVWAFGVICSKYLGNKDLSSSILIPDPSLRPSMKEILALPQFSSFHSFSSGMIRTLPRPAYEYERMDKIVAVVTDCYNEWAVNSTSRSFLLSIELVYLILPHLSTIEDDPEKWIYACISIARNLTESKPLINTHEKYISYTGGTSLREIYQICKWLDFCMYRNPYYRKGHVDRVLNQIIYGDLRLYPLVDIDSLCHLYHL